MAKIMFDPAKLELVDPKTLKKNPKNRNKHSDAQIDRFCNLLETYGMRWPILVSEQTGLIVSRWETYSGKKAELSHA